MGKEFRAAGLDLLVGYILEAQGVSIPIIVNCAGSRFG
jgi:hypothetical protein